MLTRSTRRLSGVVACGFAIACVWPARLVAAPSPPPPPERVPIAVFWMGEDDGSLGARLVEDVNGALSRKQTARPLDNADDRRALSEGGPSARVTVKIREAEGLLARGKAADAAVLFEAAETQLFADVPLESMRARLAELERGLLAAYDQLGRGADASRAADRLHMAPGSVDDVRVLFERHATPLRQGAALPPVEIVSQPPGAQVFRDLQPVGVTPMMVEGGDRTVDFVDIETPGFRRAHVALGMGGRVEVALAREDRLGVFVDHIRDQSPDAPPAEVAALGKRVGAARVLAILPDGPRKVLARWLDVKTATWTSATLRVDNAGQGAMERLAGYVTPGEGVGAGAALPQPVAAVPPPTKKKLGIWGKWYTWVAAGGVVALVVGLLIAQNVGDDKLTIKSSR